MRGLRRVAEEFAGADGRNKLRLRASGPGVGSCLVVSEQLYRLQSEDCNGSPDVVLVPPAAATFISCLEVPMPFSEEETGLCGILCFLKVWPDGHHVQVAGGD